MRPTIDTPQHLERRLRLVDEIRAKRIDDANVLGAVANGPPSLLYAQPAG
ncbi:hypothetical protein [Flavisolibacter nicotianae]|nr:hypothetical protein [Flavisolibacter nicotianae]